MRDAADIPERRLIDQALPADLWADGVGRVGSYHRFPVYSWPWFRRRAIVFWPLAILHGAFVGVWHSASMTAWHDALPLGSVGAVASLLTVSIGPLLAMLVRYRNLSYRTETVLVVVAILAGVFLGHAMQEITAAYHDMLMEQLRGQTMQTLQAVRSFSQAIGDLMGELPYWIILFLVCGGGELKTYLGERKRLIEYARRKDMVVLRRDKAETDLRLAVMQAQIEPHFLFNTLASIRSLVRVDPGRAEATISALSNYLRTTLPKLRRDVGVHSATLGEQIDICASYLELMRIRIGERLSVTIDVASALRAMDFPPLLLIPLVENAVKHGVEPQAGPVTIVIRAQLVADGELLQIDVEDDGAGLREAVGTGVGLANVREQLARRFEGAAKLEIEGREGGGVRSRVTVPIKAS